MRTRQHYDSIIILLYSLGREHLIPKSLRQIIPPSTASHWCNHQPDLVGSELRNWQQECWDREELLAKHHHLKKFVYTVIRTWISIYHAITPVFRKNKELQEYVVNAVKRLNEVMPQKTALKITGISYAAFQYRSRKIASKCLASPFQCLRRHPTQLTPKEVKTMKRLLNDERFICWPVRSIAKYALREGELIVSDSTWYKYIPRLGGKPQPEKPVKEEEKEPVTAPNQRIHIDTTFWKLNDGTQRAIVFVSDNFSKHILARHFGEHGADNVRPALRQAVETIRHYHPEQTCANLIADGGGENNAVSVNELLESYEHPFIAKLIAQKDVEYSNSPIEAINKIAKRYLRHDNPGTDEALEASISHFKEDYTSVRPHGSLNGCTPQEVYSRNLPDLDFTEQFRQAREARIAYNKSNPCQNCS